MRKQLAGTCLLAVALTAVASAQTPAGGEFRVNTYTTGNQFYPRVAMDRDGDFVVVWTSYTQDGSGQGMFGQRFAASGAARGAEFRVNTYTTGDQGFGDLAVGSQGDFVVAWMSYTQDGNHLGIFGRRFAASGAPLGSEFAVNTYTTGAQFLPTLGRAADGSFVVCWTTTDGDGSSYGIAGRRFDASGSPVGSDFLVNSYTTDSQALADIAVEGNGNFVTVWEDGSGRDGAGAGIFGQRFDATGNRLGSEFQVNTYTTFHQRAPAVSVSPTGAFTVVWSSEGDGTGSAYGVFSRLFDPAGNAVGQEFVVNVFPSGFVLLNGQAAHDARGNFVVTWPRPGVSGYLDSIAQRFSAAGARRGADFRVNTYSAGMEYLPSVASDSAGNFVVAWFADRQDAGTGGVFAQRFGGLAPAALTVDSLGNQVLEPGETVDARPSWRNFNGAPQTFGGALAGITGPAGATYTITDAGASYGTVPNGATAQCSDCYGVSVSNPSTRPAVHWDAAAVESIVPDTQGQQKQWLLHVGRSFTDVPSSNPFYRFIEVLLHRGVTSGCGGTEYCPASSAARDQMSVFVLVAKEGTGYVPPACTTPVFGDVPASSPFCPWIEELARRGVVGGCGGGNYCPSSAVTREQMAVFVLRTLDPALDPPACGTPVFADVPASSPFCRWIEELVRRGVVTGCGGGNYCPAAAVTREQMGVFITVTFDLTLYSP